MLTALLAASVLLTSSSMVTFAESGDSMTADMENPNDAEKSPAEEPAESEKVNETEPGKETSETEILTVPNETVSDGTTDGENSGDDQITDGLTPEIKNENLHNAEDPKETEVGFLMKGRVLLTNRDGQNDLLKKIKVLVYDAEEYDEEAESHVILAEVEADENGRIVIEGLQTGHYRIEYISTDTGFCPENYQAAELPEGTDYTVTMAEDEMAAEEKAGEPVEERDYFAVIPDLNVDADLDLDLELTEKPADDTEKEDTIREDEKPDTAAEDIENDAGEETEGKETTEKGEEVSEADESNDTEAGKLKIQDESRTEAPISLTGGLRINQLAEVDEDMAAAAMETRNIYALGSDMLRMASGDQWSFDVYYTGQDEKYYMESSEDFNLKYQMEFHTSRDIAVGAVEIRIPEKLLDDRDGNPLMPTEIAVPEASPDEYPIYSRNTPFNYYVDGTDLVFYNYMEIQAGTNAAWQILYKKIDVMEIRDETTWKLTPSIKVTDESQQEKTLEPLTGKVDTYARITSVSKKAYTVGGDKNYTPGLYTKKQVEQYIGMDLPAKYAGDNFYDYKYVLWRVDVEGEATQPWNLEIRDNTSIQGGMEGEVVGYNASLTATGGQGGLTDSYSEIIHEGKVENVDYSAYIVTAYPAERVQEDTVFENRFDVRLTPADGIDPAQEKGDSATWSWVDYKWAYMGNMTHISKNSGFREDYYSGWLEAYKYASENGEDFGEFSFDITGWCRGYGLTHYITTGEDGKTVGNYKEGSSYRVTTVDDFIYAYPGETGSSGAVRLNDEDYYFASISVKQEAVGYDVWEDEETTPESSGDIDQDLKIYAMFAGAEKWELVDTVPWKDSGVMSYTFTEQDLERQPWRVKVEHETINYSSTCSINLDVRIRHDSPAMKKLADYSTVRLENISGIMVEEFQDKVFQDYWHGESTAPPNYQEPGLADATRQLYGVILQRDNSYKTLTGLEPHAESHKTVTGYNDPDNSRVILNYCLTASDGYAVYSREGVDYLMKSGVPSPGRNNVVFYDLLPYGVHFDPSQEVTAGRISNLNKQEYQYEPKSWDQSQVTVTVDPDEDIIDNYRGSGRTMVVFHIQYDGSDSAVYSELPDIGELIYKNGQWAEGWGISFQAYYDWKDVDVVHENANISAFMPEDKPGAPLYQKPLVGTAEEVALDNGVIVPEDTTGEYAPFREGDLNEDGITNIRNVLYAQTTDLEDVAIAGVSRLEKLVRADSDQFGAFQSEAVVGVGRGYTYDITVSSGGTELKDIVIFDRLENAAADRENTEEDPYYPFEDGSWHGTFQSVVTTGLEEMGIEPKVYYNADRNAKVPSEGQDPVAVLTVGNGWYPAEEFPYQTSQVRALAVDLSERPDGSEFTLEQLKSASFQIKMQAPDIISETERYAYNNPSYYSVQTGNGTEGYTEANSVRVELGTEDTLEIVKEFAGEIPKGVENAGFEFTLYEEVNGHQTGFANKVYQLWELTDGEWVQNTDRIYATDSSGILTLRADEKAVFTKLPDAGRIRVEEEENPFWETETSERVISGENNGIIRTVTVKNTYRPVLYAQKRLQAVPEDVDVSDRKFTFQVRVKGENGSWTPLSDAEFWYVDSVRTDGGIPQKVTNLGTEGTGRTDRNGQFTIRQGEIIALLSCETGMEYQLKELNAGSENLDDWICLEDTVEGILPAEGDSAAVTNIYKWKDILLTKSLTHQDPADCSQRFTFQIQKVEDGKEVPVSGNEWVLLNEDGSESNVRGTLGNDGTFSCACAGKTVRIRGLEAGESYTVTETESGELYRPLNTVQEVEMPVYSTGRKVEIINDYLKRPISVTKIVNYDQADFDQAADVAEKEFTMSIQVNGSVLRNYAYILTENGSIIGEFRTDTNGRFVLKNGQTAAFEEAGVIEDPFIVTEMEDAVYEQIYPADHQPFTGNIGSEGSEVTFINGTPGGLTIRKEYEAADETSEEYVSLMRDPENREGQRLRKDAAVDLSLEVTDTGGNSYVWPRQDTQVTVVDQVTGEMTEEIWTEDMSIHIEPWKTILLKETQLPGIESYILRETRENQHRVFEWREGQWIEISQMDPSGDRPIEGTLEERPVAEIMNLAASVAFEGSEIEKRMTVGSPDVPEGAELVWRLERYDGSAWHPAEEVEYMTFDERGVTCDQTLITDETGEIILTKTENGYPYVRFIKDTVFLNLYEGASPGDLRLVEVQETSDESWGMLAGYGSADDKYGYSFAVPPEQAVAFVNSSRNTPVEIEKKMQNPSDVTFTMILEQVISAEEYPVVRTDQIRETRPGAGFSYRIFDTASGDPLGTGITGSKGEIRLKAGQYVILDLPDGTLWTVTEERKADHVLKTLSGTPEEKLTRLGDNLMLIQQRAEVTGRLDIQAVSRVNVNSPLEKEDFIVNAVYSDGSWRTLTPEEYTLEPETASSTAGPMEVTANWASGGLKGSVVLNVIGETEITREMVETGVKDADTGEDVVLRRGDVIIPEYIIWDGAEYHVVGIGDEAFGSPTSNPSMEQELTGIQFPNSIRRIGEYAFLGCVGLTGDLELPENLRIIEKFAFSGCWNLDGTLTIPKGVTSIGSHAFYNCSGLTGEIELPEALTEIEMYIFYNCYNLSGDITIPKGVTSIGQYAFYNCNFTGELLFPEDMTSIGDFAFRGCEKLTGDLILPDKIETIGQYAFSDCSGLDGRLSLPASLTKIGSGVFKDCTSLSGELVIPDTVTSIGTGAFYDCSGFTGELTIPDRVTTIGNTAFAGCSGFTGDLSISNNVSEIETNAFIETGFSSISIDNSENAITGAPWGWKGTVTWLR